MIRSGLLEALSKDKLSVFLFHKVPQRADPLMPGDITLASFERLLDQVVSQFRVLPLEDAVTRLHSGRLPRRAACITFDDGYADWMTGALPVLRQRNLHATFFITTGQFGGLPLWHERIQAAVRALPGSVLDIGMPSLGLPSAATLADRQALVVQLEQELKYLTLAAREQALLRLEAAAGVQPEQLPRMSEAQLTTATSRSWCARWRACASSCRASWVAPSLASPTPTAGPTPIFPGTTWRPCGARDTPTRSPPTGAWPTPTPRRFRSRASRPGRSANGTRCTRPGATC
jgi:peptidoglycan/xylan/chitin deacetylase (PgdA/CDA1 family)